MRSRIFNARGAFGLLAAIGIWHSLSNSTLYNSKLFPGPVVVFTALAEMIASNIWFHDVSSSMGRYFAGYIIGALLGVSLGVTTGSIRWFRDLVSPLMNFLRGTPSVALIPLAIVWFGIGDTEKIFVISWGVLFPIWLNTQAGIAEVDKHLIWAAKSLGASQMRIHLEIFLLGALPYILAGGRMAIATGFFALAAAEMAGAFNGVAFRVFHSHQMFRTDRMLASIFTIGLLGIGLDYAFVRFWRWRLPWWSPDDNKV